MSSSPAVGKMTWIRRGSSCGLNARLIKNLKAGEVDQGEISIRYGINEGRPEAYRSCEEWSWRCRWYCEGRRPLAATCHEAGTDHVGSGGPTRMAEALVALVLVPAP